MKTQKKEKLMARPRWLDQQISYGCLLRGLLTLLAFALLSTGAILLILSVRGTIAPSWSNPLATIFSISGVLFGFLQWALPLAPLRLSKRNQVYDNLLEQLKKTAALSGQFGILLIRSREQIRLRVVFQYENVRSHYHIGDETVTTSRHDQIYVGVITLRAATYTVEDESGRKEPISVLPGVVTELRWS